MFGTLGGRKHPGVELNLHGANLSGFDLREANISGANMGRAELSDIASNPTCPGSWECSQPGRVSKPQPLRGAPNIFSVTPCVPFLAAVLFMPLPQTTIPIFLFINRATMPM
jgi:Pentapeptide repeats (8 copies)